MPKLSLRVQAYSSLFLTRNQKLIMKSTQDIIDKYKQLHANKLLLFVPLFLYKIIITR